MKKKTNYIRNRVIKELGDFASKGGVYSFWFKGYEDLIYIGSTSNFRIRFIAHLESFKNGKCSPKIKSFLTKEVVNGFQFKIIKEIYGVFEPLKLENTLIKQINPKLNTIKNYMMNETEDERYGRCWTKKFTDLNINDDFKAERQHYSTLNGTRQRMGYKYPERKFTIHQAVKIKGDLITVKRIK